jgi:hypothetical protein
LIPPIDKAINAGGTSPAVNNYYSASVARLTTGKALRIAG